MTEPVGTMPSKYQTLRWRVSRFFSGFGISFWEWLLDLALRNHPMSKNSNIVSYAERELRLAGWYDKDAFYGELVPNAVLRSARLFSIEGHSGMSAGLVNNLTSTVCMFKPLSPLTGEDDEWNEVGDGLFQNKRMSSIFKEDGRAYWSDGRVFREPSGCMFTSSKSRVEVKFPWTLREPEIVDVSDPDKEAEND